MWAVLGDAKFGERALGFFEVCRRAPVLSLLVALASHLLLILGCQKDMWLMCAGCEEGREQCLGSSLALDHPRCTSLSLSTRHRLP